MVCKACGGSSNDFCLAQARIFGQTVITGTSGNSQPWVEAAKSHHKIWARPGGLQQVGGNRELFPTLRRQGVMEGGSGPPNHLSLL